MANNIATPETNAISRSSLGPLITRLCEQSRDVDFTKRPNYSEIYDVVRSFTEMDRKAPGASDLEGGLKACEESIRLGQGLFGRISEPFHTLKQCMEDALERNMLSFDVTSDKYTLPGELSLQNGDSNQPEVFCICRRAESGMMVECKLCHEWYHGECLRIDGDQVMDEEKYTCPVCNPDVMIARDFVRPKLEHLQAWQENMSSLSFRLDEKEILDKILENAHQFRDHLAPFGNLSRDARMQRFYLRKLEGGGILLSDETSLFREQLFTCSAD